VRRRRQTVPNCLKVAPIWRQLQVCKAAVLAPSPLSRASLIDFPNELLQDVREFQQLLPKIFTFPLGDTLENSAHSGLGNSRDPPLFAASSTPTLMYGEFPFPLGDDTRLDLLFIRIPAEFFPCRLLRKGPFPLM